MLQSLRSLPQRGMAGKKDDSSEWKPVMNTLPPAPDAVFHLVKCGCLKTRCATKHCQCSKAGLPCTDLWSCAHTDEQCANATSAHNQDDVNYDDSNDDTEEVILSAILKKVYFCYRILHSTSYLKLTLVE